MVNIGVRQSFGLLSSGLTNAHKLVMQFSVYPNLHSFFFNLTGPCFFSYKSEVVQQREFVRLNVSMSFQYLVLMILGTEENTDWNKQKNKQFSYTFTWSHSHSSGTKQINCFFILQINWRKIFRCYSRYFLWNRKKRALTTKYLTKICTDKNMAEDNVYC